MAHVQDQWVGDLARIRERCELLQLQNGTGPRETPVQRDRQALLDIVDMLAAQLAVERARVMVLKTAQLVAAEETQKRSSDQDDRCTCRHARQAHDHYRAGSDCSLCDCHQWKSEGAPRQRAWT
jgi:hypothetical protein